MEDKKIISPCIQFFSINGEPKVGVVYEDPESLFEIIVTIMPDRIIMDAIKEAVVLFLDSTNRSSEINGMLIALEYVYKVIETTKNALNNTNASSNNYKTDKNSRRSIPVVDPELALNASTMKSVGG